MIQFRERILMTGITSIHGWPVWNALKRVYGAERVLGICPPATKYPIEGRVEPVCITDRERLAELCERFRPTVVVHCAGVCDLDVCEERPEWAYDINVNGARVVRDVFAEVCPIYYMSTDLVFSGERPPECGYDEAFEADPVSVAGKTFKQAEAILQEVASSCIVRLGLPLGDSFTGTKGAIDWIKSRLLKDRPVTLFYDELRSCVWCEQIAEMVLGLLALELRGMYHFGGRRSWTLYEIGEYVLKEYGCAPELLKGIRRHEEIGGPPRIGDVSMNCDKIRGEFEREGIVISGFSCS